MSIQPYIASFTLTELQQATGGQWLTQPTLPIETKLSPSTDSRSITPSQCFIPLVGAKFDGHHYVEAVSKEGVGVIFVNQANWVEHPEWHTLPGVLGVPNTLKAYQDLATCHRRRLAKNLTLIGLTGSSGKTTTKEMLAATLSAFGKTQKTLKNFNNEIGVPLTLLSIEPDTQYAVVEMAMRGAGQIEELTLCAYPDIAIVNNIGPAHIEQLGSLDAIAQTKLEILKGLNPQTGKLITNGDDPLLQQWTPSLIKRDWQPEDPSQWQPFYQKDAHHIAYTPSGGMLFEYQGKSITLPVPGEHMVTNALCVLKITEALGLDLDTAITGLSGFQSESGRWSQQALPGYQNAFVIDDAYNSNPDSCRASLATFISLPEAGLKKVLILAGMLELGTFSQQYHRELGQWLAAQSGLAALITIGDEAKTIDECFSQSTLPHTHVASSDEIGSGIEALKLDLENSLILLKGSRGYHLEAWLTACQSTV